MIAKITRGKSPHAIGRYLHGPGRANEHAFMDGLGLVHEGGQVIGGSMAADGDTDARHWARQMQRLNDKRPDIDRPIHQISLSAAPGDPVMTNEQWEQIAREYARDMGLEHNPWVVVRHDLAHVHIVANRINGDGRVWDARNDRYKSQKATRAIEERHGLTRVPSRSKGRPTPSQTPELTHPAERALKERGAPSWRSHIKAAIEEGKAQASTTQEFTKALARSGVGVYQNKTGEWIYTIKTANGGTQKIGAHKLGAAYQPHTITQTLTHNAATKEALRSQVPYLVMDAPVGRVAPSTKADVTERIKRRAQGHLDPTAGTAQSAPSVDEALRRQHEEDPRVQYQRLQARVEAAEKEFTAARKPIYHLEQAVREADATLDQASREIVRAMSDDADLLWRAGNSLKHAKWHQRSKARKALDRARSEVQSRWPNIPLEALKDHKTQQSHVDACTTAEKEVAWKARKDLRAADAKVDTAREKLTFARIQALQATTAHTGTPTQPQPLTQAQRDAQTLTHQQRQTQQRRGRTR